MVREEMKKIWRPGIILLLALLGLVFYYMFMNFYIARFPSSASAAGGFEIAKEWVQEYGTSLEPEEEAEIVNVKLPELNAEADQYVAQNELCQQYGLTTYADFEEFYYENAYKVQGDLTEEQWTLYSDAETILSYIQSEDTNYIYGRLWAVQSYTEQYELLLSDGSSAITSRFYDEISESEYNHACTAFFGADSAWQNMLPVSIPSATSNYLAYLLVWIVLSDCLLLSPLLVRDRMRGMRALQWSSRRGRGIINAQFAAVMLSAFLLTTLNILIFGGIFTENETYIFAACRIFSFMSVSLSWVNWSYGVWCLVLMLLCYTVSFGIAALAFFLSRFSANYVTLILKLIPLFVVAALLSYNSILRAFYYGNRIYQITGIPGIEAILTALIFLSGLVLGLVTCIRQRKKELLEA